MEFNELKKKYDINNKKKLILLMRKNAGNWLSYEDIEKIIPNQSGNTGKLLAHLKEDKLLKIQQVNNNRNTIRKRFKLTLIGQKLGDYIALSGLNNEELRILNFLKESKKFYTKKLNKDFWDFIDLFYEFGFNENAPLFSKMLRDFMLKIMKLANL